MSVQTPPGGQPGYENPKAAAKAAKAYAKASRPWFKKKRYILLIVVVIIIIAAVAGGGGSGDGPEVVGDPKDAAATKGGNDDKATKDEAPKAGTKGNPIAVGQTVKLEGTQYTVGSVKTASTVGSQYFSEAAGGIYVIVDLTIENTKNETKTFFDSAAHFIGSNNKSYDTDSDGTFAAMGDDGETLIFEEMQPDVPKTGILVFDVPKDAMAGGLLEVSDLFGRGDAYIDLGLK